MIHGNMGEYLLSVPLCFIVLLKMNIIFLFLYKDLWVGCFVYCLLVLQLKMQVLPILKDFSIEQEHRP